MKIFEQVRIAVVWLWRCRHSRGFGIQSPWAYSFVRYVVNEHWPYYAYEQLNDETQGPIAKKLLQLYLRLANFRQKDSWTIVTADRNHSWEAAVRRYLLAGCREADCRIAEPVAAETLTSGMVVVEGIGWKRRQRSLWQQLIADNHASVSFDLYYCGIVFFDQQLTKRQYVVNF